MHGDADISHAEARDNFLFVCLGVLADVAEIDHGLDSEAGDFLESAFGRLGPPIDVIVDLLKIAQVLIAGVGPRRHQAKTGYERENGGAPPKGWMVLHLTSSASACPSGVGQPSGSTEPSLAGVRQLSRLTPVDAALAR